MSIKRWETLLDQAAAGTSDWIDCDVRYEKISVRPIIVNLTSGDSIAIQAIVKDVKGIDKSFLDELEDADITTLKTYTTSGNDLIEGNWTYLRVVKVGANGAARVQGF